MEGETVAAAAAPAAAPDPQQLYSRRECAWLALYCAAAWVAAHYLLWFFWKLGAVPLVPRSPIDIYRRRLCRSQVYCSIASVGGVYLLLQCGWNAYDLLRVFSWKHQVLFCMAVAHWVVSIWEDRQCVSFLGAGKNTFFLEGADVGAWFAKVYLIHHVVAGLGFAAVTYLHVCTGIGAFGLLFELPVLWMNHREFMVCIDPRPSWFCEVPKTQLFWRWLEVAFHVGRTVPTVVYIYSVIFWSDDLNTLTGEEYFTYHFMAIFFTILNYFLKRLLNGWKRSDLDHATDVTERRQGLRGDGADGGGGLDEEQPADSEEEVVVDGPPAKLMVLKESEFYIDQGAEYTRQVWIEIDGIAYEVTSFLAQHPGGEAVLRKYTGRDASEAFHRVRHSMRAKISMQKFAIGSIDKRERAYRIFEHERAEIMLTVMQSFFTFCVFGLVCSRSFLGQYLAALPSTAPMSVLLVPGLVFSAGMGSAWCTLNFLNGQGFFPTMSKRSSWMGLGLAMLSTGLHLARRLLPASSPWFTPTGVELAAVGLFAVTDLFELLASRRNWSWHPAIGAAAVGTGLYMRGALGLASLAPEHLVGAGLLTLGAVFVALAIDKDQPRDQVMDGCKFAFVYSALALLLLTREAAAWEAVLALWASSWWTLLKSAPLPILANLCFATIVNHSHSHSPSWCMRCLANCMGAASGLMGGMTHYCWLSWVAWFAENGSTAMRYRKRDDEYTANGIYQSVPDYMVGTRVLWDTFRAALVALVWLIVHIPGRALVNVVLPEEVAVYSNTMPIFDLGDLVSYGVAAYMAPTQARHYKEAPSHFECSVQHIDASTEAGAQDVSRAANNLRDRWKELRKDDPVGLVANIVCFFTGVEGRELTKEIRIACWQTEEDALAWNEKKAAATTKRRGAGSAAGLQTAGELQVPLEPQCPIRHQDRCMECCRLIESDRLGVRAPRRCKACGKKGYEYPFF